MGTYNAKIATPRKRYRTLKRLPVDAEWFRDRARRAGFPSNAQLAKALRWRTSAVSRRLSGEWHWRLVDVIEMARVLGATNLQVIRAAGCPVP